MYTYVYIYIYYKYTYINIHTFLKKRAPLKKNILVLHEMCDIVKILKHSHSCFLMNKPIGFRGSSPPPPLMLHPKTNERKTYCSPKHLLFKHLLGLKD